MFASEFQSEFFSVIGTVSDFLPLSSVTLRKLICITQILGTTVTLLWLMVSILTIRKAFSGELFKI